MAHACNRSTQEVEAQMDLWVYGQPGLQNKYQDRDTQSLSWKKKSCKNVWAEMETPKVLGSAFEMFQSCPHRQD